MPPGPTRIRTRRSPGSRNISPSIRTASTASKNAEPGNMLHHIPLGVADMERAARFYDAILAPLGYTRVWSDVRPGEEDQAVGYGKEGGGDKLALKQHDAHTAP